MKKAAEKFVLIAYYDASRHGLEFDSKIRGVVGRPEDGAGTNLQTMERDISFSFSEESAAKKALSRLKKQKIKAELSAC